MTTTPNDSTTRPGRPPVVDLATWQTARDELLIREKAHTHAGDALAAARRRLPMVEFDGTVEVVGPDGPVPFLDLFQGRNELVVYKHMWYDGAPHQGQCEGCTMTTWQLKDAVYLNARGVSFAVLTTGRWDEVAAYVEFMGYTQPWYSVRDVEEPVGGEMGYLTSFLRDGDRVFLTYSTTGRGNEPVAGALRPARPDAVRPGRGLGGQPRRLARGRPGLLVLAFGRGREPHLGTDRPTRAAVDPPRRDPGGDPRSARPPPLTAPSQPLIRSEMLGQVAGPGRPDRHPLGGEVDQPGLGHQPGGGVADRADAARLGHGARSRRRSSRSRSRPRPRRSRSPRSRSRPGAGWTSRCGGAGARAGATRPGAARCWSRGRRPATTPCRRADRPRPAASCSPSASSSRWSAVTSRA